MLIRSVFAEPTARLTLVMSSLFLALGVMLPFVPQWLQEARGLTGLEVGAIAAAAPIARIISGPMLATWADGFRDRRVPIALFALGALVFYALFFNAHGFAALFALGLVAATLMQAAAPLVESATLRASAQGRIPFGIARGIGSATFIVANVAGGALIARFGLAVMPAWILASLAAAALSGWFALKPDPAPAAAAQLGFRGRLGVGFRLLMTRPFARIVLAAGLIQAGHGFYYGFSVLAWSAQGLSPVTIGLLWGFGVAAEILFLASLPQIEKRVSPETLLIVGGAGALVRWSVLAAAPTGLLLWAAQALHALSFAATHVGALRLVMRAAPEEVVGLAQTFYAALAAGVLLGLATLASGFLFDRLGAAGYLGMAALAASGLVIAAPLVRR
jgi:PPP family 3-phenylpropionic acid transporter